VDTDKGPVALSNEYENENGLNCETKLWADRGHRKLTRSMPGYRAGCGHRRHNHRRCNDLKFASSMLATAVANHFDSRAVTRHPDALFRYTEPLVFRDDDVTGTASGMVRIASEVSLREHGITRFRSTQSAPPEVIDGDEGRIGVLHQRELRLLIRLLDHQQVGEPLPALCR
jgi:hypothetical protein